MGTEMITAAGSAVATVEDVSDQLQLVAFNPADMPTAQASLAEWFRGKIEIVKRDAADICEGRDVAIRSGWKSEPLKRQARNALARVEYYAKCLAAVEAGFCIVPNFPVDVIAIRTTKDRPKADESDSRHTTFRQQTNSPPAGSGRYVSTVPSRRTAVRYDADKKTGELNPVRYYFPEDFQDVEFPVALCQPAVMDATSRAMAMKIFDAIGVLPSTRKPDPIVVGHIYRPGRPKWGSDAPLTFLIAWWIDVRTL